MEINTEINKVFGQEMARLFAETISEEEMKANAKQVWQDIISKSGWRPSKLTEYLEQALYEKVKIEIEKILESEEAKVDIHNRAEGLINKIRDEAEKKIVDKTSDIIAGMYNGYDGGYSLKGVIKNVIMECMNR